MSRCRAFQNGANKGEIRNPKSCVSVSRRLSPSRPQFGKRERFTPDLTRITGNSIHDGGIDDLMNWRHGTALLPRNYVSTFYYIPHPPHVQVAVSHKITS